MLETKWFNLVLAKTVDPNEHDYFETIVGQPSFANLTFSLAYGMIHQMSSLIFNLFI